MLPIIALIAAAAHGALWAALAARCLAARAERRRWDVGRQAAELRRRAAADRRRQL